MGISNNAPTMSYIHISGTSVVWNNETYMVQDFATNKRYIYWNADTPHQLNASNVMPNRSTKQYLVIVNDNGMHSLVPSTSADFSISFEGNSNQAIKDRIFGLYEKNEEFGDKFVAIEQGIDGIKSIVGETEETTDGTLIDRMSKVEQRADEINLSVEEVSKKYNDDKEINELRESLNSSVIKLNSALGTFKSELTDYFKNNEISSEEKTKIKTQLEVLTNRKITLEGYVNTVRLIAEKNNQTQDVVALDSAKKSLQTAHDNLHNNINNAVIDNIITPTENTIIIDSFAKYNLKINELKNTCDDIIFLGVGGVITEELANINIKSNEIKLSVSKVESESDNIDKKYADIILNPETGILSKVEHIDKQINEDGGISERISKAEEKITDESITQTVKKNFYTKNDINDKGYQTASDVKQTVEALEIKFSESGGCNFIRNSCFLNELKHWSNWGDCSKQVTDSTSGYKKSLKVTTTGSNQGVYQTITDLCIGKMYTLSAYVYQESGVGGIQVYDGKGYQNVYTNASGWNMLSVMFVANATNINVQLGRGGQGANGTYYFTAIMLQEGQLDTAWTPHPSEVYDGITTIDKDGITVTASNVKSKTSMTSSGFKITKTDTNEDVFKVNSDGTLKIKGSIEVTSSGSTVPATIITGTISNDRLNTSIVNGATNGTNAQSVLNSNKDNWNNSYNRVQDWAYGGDITGKVTIDGGNIQADTIKAIHIAANTITANEIAANTITANEIAANTITANEIAAGAITSNKIAAGAITAGMITSGTLDTNKVNIKGSTTKKIVIANDNYCVYDGAETDINRKVFVGFRTNSATNVPSVMLGYNGINPSVDGAVVSGGTYTTYSHYPNNNNPESINQSYGALAFKYGAQYYQFSTLNMYQNGDIDLKSGASIYFRPNLRAKDNHVFAISDTEVGSRVPFKCTSTIYSNGDITTDRGLNASSLDIPNVSINSNGIYTTGHITGGMIKTDSYRFTNNHTAFGKNEYNNNMMNGCHWDWQYHNLVNVKVYPVSLSLPTIDEPTIQTVSKTHKDTLSQIKFPEVRELSVEESAPSIDISDVTNKEEITTNGDVDLIKLVYLLVKNVQNLKQENEELLEIVNTII